MRKWSAKIFMAAPFALGFVLVAGCGVRPSDTELINNFQSHRADFETIARMFREDRIVQRMNGASSSIGAEGPEAEDAERAGISPQRVAEYSRLIDRVRATRNVYYNISNDTTIFIMWAPGLAGMSGLEGKNVVYAPKEALAPVVADTDQYRPPSGKESIPVYRNIEGSWYVEHSFN